MQVFFRIVFFIYSAIAVCILVFVYSQDGSAYGVYARGLGVALVGLPWTALFYSMVRDLSDRMILLLGWVGIFLDLGILGLLAFGFSSD